MDDTMGVDMSTSVQAGVIDRQGDCYSRKALEDAAANAKGIFVYDAEGLIVGQVHRMRLMDDGQLVGRITILSKDLGLMGDCDMAVTIKSRSIERRVSGERQANGYNLHRESEFLRFDVQPGGPRNRHE